MAKRRLMSDRLIRKYLGMFPSETFMTELHEAVAQNDRVAAFDAVHKMKGVAANLALTELQESAVALTEQLRDGQQDPDPALYQAVSQAYDKTLRVINAFCQDC